MRSIYNEAFRHKKVIEYSELKIYTKLKLSQQADNVYAHKMIPQTLLYTMFSRIQARNPVFGVQSTLLYVSIWLIHV